MGAPIATIHANRLWLISKPLRNEARASLEGEDMPLLAAIVRYNLKHRKADIVGRLTGGRFTNYASMGGRIGNKRLSTFGKFAGGATNLGIASYGAAVKALAEGHKTLEAIIQAVLTGSPEYLPAGYQRSINDSLSCEERELVENLESILSEVMLLTQVTPGPIPIEEFCARPENLSLKGLCK